MFRRGCSPQIRRWIWGGAAQVGIGVDGTVAHDDHEGGRGVERSRKAGESRGGAARGGRSGPDGTYALPSLKCARYGHISYAAFTKTPSSERQAKESIVQGSQARTHRTTWFLATVSSHRAANVGIDASECAARSSSQSEVDRAQLVSESSRGSCMQGHEITRLLHRWRGGHGAALDECTRS